MVEQRKQNQLVCDHARSELALSEQENKKSYVTLLQNQLLGVDNKALLSEIHNSDENHLLK